MTREKVARPVAGGDNFLLLLGNLLKGSAPFLKEKEQKIKQFEAEIENYHTKARKQLIELTLIRAIAELEAQIGLFLLQQYKEHDFYLKFSESRYTLLVDEDIKIVVSRLENHLQTLDLKPLGLEARFHPTSDPSWRNCFFFAITKMIPSREESKIKGTCSAASLTDFQAIFALTQKIRQARSADKKELQSKLNSIDILIGSKLKELISIAVELAVMDAASKIPYALLRLSVEDVSEYVVRFPYWPRNSGETEENHFAEVTAGFSKFLKVIKPDTKDLRIKVKKFAYKHDTPFLKIVVSSIAKSGKKSLI